MFSEYDLGHYLTVKNKLSKCAVDYLTSCYKEEPSRTVGAHAKTNIVSWVPSEKLNGRTFSTESRGAERALNTLAQFDDNVLWHGDQPQPIDIYRTHKNGKQRRGSYTPDALSLTKQGPVIIEAKTIEEVEKLLINKSKDWKRLDNGDVVFLPAVVAFSKLGLKHITYVYRPEDRYHIANLEQILWVREGDDQYEAYKNAIENELKKNFTLSLTELRTTLKLDSYAPLISAIDQGYIVADLKNKLITGPDSCLVSSSYALLEHGRELRSSQLIYTPDLVKPQSLSMVPTQKTAEEALNRLAEVNSGRSSRNIRRWKKRIKAGEKLGLSPFQSLVSLHHRCGENSVHLNSKVKDFLDGYLLNEHISKQGISTYRGHKYYQYLAKDVHPEYEPVCKKTFARHLSSIHPEVIGRARGGKRLGNSMALPSDPMERNLKAQVAWERAAIDHYCVDLYLIVYNKSGEVFVDRPWLTLMIDLFTGKVLAFSISFEKPSRRAVAKVLRACVRNHQKLPREIIFDRGAEFKSVYLASLLAHHSIILSLRPASHSRFGGEVEGFFGEFMKQWLSQREGNLAKFKEARSVDGKMAPRKKAVLSPSDFHKELSAFCKWRENKCRGTGSHSSEALFEQSSLDFPHIARLVEYDAEFIATTAIEAKQFTLDMQRGINVQGLWYSSPSMQLLIGKPKKNEVRIDPENPNLIFVKVIDQWVPFYGSEINTYSAKSSEHQIADGLIKHEATFLKRKIREQDDLSLAGLVHQMNQHHSTEDETHDLAVEQLGPSEDTTPKFSKLKKAIVRPVNRQEWRS